MCLGQWGYSPTRNDNEIGPLTDFDSYWLSLVLNFDECPSQILLDVFGTKLNDEVGILGFVRRQQSRVFDRLLQLLVQLCFGLQRENLEIFAEAIRVIINEEFTQVQYSITHIFDFDNLPPRVDLEIFTPSRDFDNLSPSVDLEIFALSGNFDNLSPRVDLEIFAECHLREY
ncbi:hypothetical protein V1477_001032 [Vespula maculifrons]|uniref:Uncharacterized protein n=1 Tax=Vespula maculifrons TaxID=7453 RepID=A0ABD2D1X7_VESMC